ncbi:MAG: hypothetical protein AAGH81_01175 [Bacteroidota bacterium]
MKKWILFFNILFFAPMCSCSSDDLSGQNSIRFGDDTFTIEKAYYIFDFTDFRYQEFLVILTDGSIESFFIPANDYVFSPETQNVLLLRARIFDEEQAATIQLPTGSFVYGNRFETDSLVFLRLQQGCQSLENEALEDCLEIVDLPFVENSSGLMEIVSRSSQNSYEINLNINFSGELTLSGTYSGSVLTFNK